MKVENEMALPITKSVTVMLLEPYAGKLARTVLRGESSRKGADLLDYCFCHCLFLFQSVTFLGCLKACIELVLAHLLTLFFLLFIPRER